MSTSARAGKQAWIKIDDKGTPVTTDDVPEIYLIGETDFWNSGISGGSDSTVCDDNDEFSLGLEIQIERTKGEGIQGSSRTIPIQAVVDSECEIKFCKSLSGGNSLGNSLANSEENSVGGCEGGEDGPWCLEKIGTRSSYF